MKGIIMVHSISIKKIEKLNSATDTIMKYFPEQQDPKLKELKDFIKDYEGSEDYVEVLMQYQINKIYKALEYLAKKIDEK